MARKECAFGAPPPHFPFASLISLLLSGRHRAMESCKQIQRKELLLPGRLGFPEHRRNIALTGGEADLKVPQHLFLFLGKCHLSPPSRPLFCLRELG